MYPNKVSPLTGPVEEKQPHNITEPPPPPYLHAGYYQYRYSSF